MTNYMCTICNLSLLGRIEIEISGITKLTSATKVDNILYDIDFVFPHLRTVFNFCFTYR